MTTLTSSTTLTILPGAPVVEQAVVNVLPLGAAAPGTGRLVHPVYGALEYPYAPDIWEGVDTDLIVPPIWASTQTLGGVANTLWAGHVKDVQITERWTSEVSMPMEFVRMLLNFYMNPPAPETGFIVWSPQYTNDLSYNVMLTAVGSGGDRLSLSYISRQGWLEGDLTLQMRIASRA